jgi:hypothetical protein
MAEPLKVIRRLDQVTTDYTVFERDQVLTHDQLNGVTEYLDDQARLTRVGLLGIGIVDGLQVGLAEAGVSIGKGIGVTSDGDLIGLDSDTVFDRFRPYGKEAPAYAPFYNGEEMLPLFELLPVKSEVEGESLDRLPLSLKEVAVLAFMESYENNPDLCTGGDCDNLGITALNTRRFLLLGREHAAALAKAQLADGRLSTAAELAARLPRLAVARPELSARDPGKVPVDSMTAFVQRYREACEKTLKPLAAALSTLQKSGKGIPGFLPPGASDWAAALNRNFEGLAAAGNVGIQYFHAFLKDLVAVFNALREALFADDAILCPSTDVFPKHLLLGDLLDPGQLRTGRYPAPWLSGQRESRDEARFLLRQLDVLLAAFAVPATQSPRITPSRVEAVALAERAIPAYYQPDDKFDLRAVWNRRLTKRGEKMANIGYHWVPARPGQADDPFLNDVGDRDFFRIEGHLGMPVSEVEPAIEALIRQYNLPISVTSVLLHSDRIKIWRGPRFKHTALHSLHYLLRQDVASQLKDNLAYVGKLKNEVAGAQALDQAEAKILNRPLSFSYVSESNSTSFDVAGVVGGAESKVTVVSGKLAGSGTQPGLLQAGKYKEFASKAGSWKVEMDDAVVETAKARESLGHIMRSDIASPIDAMVTSKSPLWIGWLDDIIKKRDEDKTERLLFSKMIVDHPGLEHRGGCVPGGTFVLAYDDKGTVIGDFMLPYWIDDIDEEEQRADPPLILPDLRLPNFIKPIKVIKPMITVLDDYKLKNILPEMKLQQGYVDFVQKSVSAFGGVIKEAAAIKTTSVVPKTGDDNMNRMFEKLEYNKSMAKEMRIQLMDEGLPPERRSWLEKQVDTLDRETAETVKATTEYFAVNAAPELKTGTAAAQVYVALNESISQIGNAEVTSKLNTDLNALQVDVGKVSPSNAQMIGNVVKLGGFRG